MQFKTAEQILADLDAKVGAILSSGFQKIQDLQALKTALNGASIDGFQLVLENLDVTLQHTTFSAKHVRLWKSLAIPAATLDKLMYGTPILHAPQNVDFIVKSALEDEEGLLTPLGMKVAHKYASAWVSGSRDLSVERKYPELAGLFYDIRNDEALAQEHAS
jgi:hypothetical protein